MCCAEDVAVVAKGRKARQRKGHAPRPKGRPDWIVVSQDDAATENLLASMRQLTDDVVPAQSWEPLLEEFPALTRGCVEEMSRLISGHDSLDILVRVRQHCAPPYGPRRESAVSVPIAALDVVALVLLGLGLPSASGEPVVSAGSVAAALCEQAQRVLYLSMMVSRAETADFADGMGELANFMRSSETQIRGRQYPSIAAEINDSILGVPQVREVMERVLNFTYDDAHAVDAAVTRELESRYERNREDVWRIMHGGESVDADSASAGVAALENMFAHPARLHTITAEQIAVRSGVSVERVARVLDHTCLTVEVAGGRGAEELIAGFIAGFNPAARLTWIRRVSGEYLALIGDVLEDEIRRFIEPDLKCHGAEWRVYDRRRAAATEGRAAQLLAQLLGVDAPTHVNLKYMVPKKDNFPETVASDVSSSDLHTTCKSTEADCLIIVDGVAICVEVKAATMSQGARRGLETHLHTALKRTVIQATNQADRLKQLILINGGLWSEGLEWIDLSEVIEVYSVVVSLDELGPLGIAADAMTRAGLLHSEQRPWMVSLHDLSVTAEIVHEPAQFLAWLRRRTQSETARLLTSFDELDLLMWFIQGKFYFEPDPVMLRDKYPGLAPARTGEIRRYKDQARTFVGTHTDELDAWMYQHGSDDTSPPRPERSDTPWVQTFIAISRQRRFPGWLTMGADLVGMSEASQKSVAHNATEACRRTFVDGLPHTSAQNFLAPWAHSLLVIETSAENKISEFSKLKYYLKAKKYQMHATRALGVVVNPRGEPVEVLSLSDPWKEDTDLDALVREMRLVPLDRSPTAPPPSARPKKVRGLPSGAVRKRRR